MTAGVIGSTAAVGGAVIGAVVTGVGESVRTKASRKFDRRVRQLDEVAALADTIDDMTIFPTNPSEDLRDGLISWDKQRLGEISRDVKRLIRKTQRYTCDPEVTALLVDLERWREEGGIEVERGHALMRQQDSDPSVDLSEVLTLDLWHLNIQARADRCVQLAKDCLGEDEPIRWRKWGALALVVLLLVLVLVVAVVLAVVP